MSLRFEQILTEGIAQLSYVVGDDATQTAAVVDPRPDVDVYLGLARRYKLAITHVFETHIHADFVSGARELAAQTGAKICLSREGGARYGFEHRALGDSDRFEFGSSVLTCRHTPGHTPEHLSFLLSDREDEGAPWGVLSGDSLFVDSVGRPDLLGDEQTDQLANQLFDTMQSFYLRLADNVLLYPGHGHGSPCGADIGDRLISSIGRERGSNLYLQIDDRRRFIDHVLSTAPPVPKYYPRMKWVNAEGPKVLGHLPAVQALPPEAFRQVIQNGDAVLVDTRSMLAFGGGHLPGALNIGARAELSIWAGWMLDPQKPLLLVLESDSDLSEVVAFFIRTGYIRFAGYLAGGMTAWTKAGLELAQIEQMSVHQLNQSHPRQVLDVRAPLEWRNGHIPGAQHYFLPELRDRIHELDRDQPTVTYCDSGYRASLAASILAAEGFSEVRNVPGSWQAWTAAGLPVEKPSRPAASAGAAR